MRLHSPSIVINFEFHPVDAEPDVEERAKNGRQPRHPDPSDRRRHIALGHQCMRGDGRGHDDMEGADQKRLDLKQRLCFGKVIQTSGPP